MADIIRSDIPNFTWEEIVTKCNHDDGKICPGNGTVLITDRLLDHMYMLQELRNNIGPIRITSGYRSPIHNKRINGAQASQHMIFATDIIPKDYSLDSTRDLAKTIGFTCTILYPSFLHLDLRKDAYHA